MAPTPPLLNVTPTLSLSQPCPGKAFRLGWLPGSLRPHYAMSSSSYSSSSVSLPLLLLSSFDPVALSLPQVGLHSILSFSNESYGQKTSVSIFFKGKNEQEIKTVEVLDVDAGSFNPQLGKSNAVLLMLCRNEEVDGAVKSVRELEDRFNHKYHYPWVFLNEVEFTEDFKRRVHPATSCS